MTTQHPLTEHTPSFPNKFENLSKTPLIRTTFRINEFLGALKCDSPLFPTENGVIATAYEDDTLSDAFQKMIQHQVLSLPVLETLTRRPLYVLSMYHMMDFLLHTFNQNEFKDDMWHTILRYFTDPSSCFNGTKIGELAGKINRALDPVYTIPQSASVSEAVRLMVDRKCHRLLVVDNQGNLVNLITQSRIVQLLHPVLDSIPMMSNSIAELGIGSGPVLSVFDTKSAYDAFKMMQVTGVGALGVIDKNGTLIGNISVSDLKLIGYDVRYWNLLGKSVKEYLAQVNAKPEMKIKSFALAFQPDKSEAPIVVKCRPFHSFGFAIRLMSFYRVHRLYIVDDQGKAIGVITLSDVLQSLVHSERK